MTGTSTTDERSSLLTLNNDVKMPALGLVLTRANHMTLPRQSKGN